MVIIREGYIHVEDSIFRVAIIISIFKAIYFASIETNNMQSVLA